MPEVELPSGRHPENSKLPGLGDDREIESISALQRSENFSVLRERAERDRVVEQKVVFIKIHFPGGQIQASEHCLSVHDDELALSIDTLCRLIEPIPGAVPESPEGDVQILIHDDDRSDVG